ncbi:MAG TPA: hypothetical protein VFH51_03340, partial [Myxococcota bacterium]|nr:hypothetical protein [Myxococcota bacterium]
MPELERLGALASDMPAVVRALRAAARVIDGADSLDVLLRAGALAQQLQDAEGATIDYLRAVGVDAARAQRAVSGLQHLHTGASSAPKLVNVARLVADGLEAAQQVEVWRVVARLCEQMKTPQEQIAAWKAVLEQKPGDPEALAELDKLYMASGDVNDVVLHLKGKLEQATDDSARATYGIQLAETLEEKLSDMPGALSAWLQVTQAAPGERKAWQHVAALYRQAGDLRECANAMQRELSLLSEGLERREKLLAYATLCVKELGDVQSGVAALKSVLAQDPANATALGLLEELRVGVGDAESTATVLGMLMGAYRAANRWQEWVACQASHLDLLTDKDARLAVLKDMASIKGGKLNDAAGAYMDLETAFRERPDDAGLRLDLEKAAETANRWEALAQAYGSALSQLGDTDPGRSVRRKLAEVLDKRLGRAGEAVEHYKALAGGALPDDLPSLEAMERLLRAENRPSELAEVLSAVA